MLLQSAAQARAYGAQVRQTLENDGVPAALDALNDILCERTPFRLLDFVGAALDAAGAKAVDELLQAIAGQRSEGGWVVIASALRERQPRDLLGALEASRGYIAQSAVWYGCDILGERVPGPALVAQFQPTLEILSAWRGDPDAWVRRALGVAGHFWAKRSRGLPGSEAQARTLLDFFNPMLEEKDYDAAKGVGWALKTCGRYYPEVCMAWLEEQLLQQGRKPAAVVKRKALKFLPTDFKKKVEDSHGA
jgi:3-methyladenine DNA glycosylase AlkD